MRSRWGGHCEVRKELSKVSKAVSSISDRDEIPLTGEDFMVKAGRVTWEEGSCDEKKVLYGEARLNVGFLRTSHARGACYPGVKVKSR